MMTMRYFNPDSSELTGGNLSRQSVGAVPSVMDNDPNADEQIINQQAGEQYPKDVEEPAAGGKITPDNLADSIAYAIDGSGPGPTNDTTDVGGHKIITEGITGAGLDDEEQALRS
ncbi:hypothetical protein ACFSUS_06185 [Spirosoma soli]|uniref:Uncharacterized protein n=1 Tax=Spirosoma soli TaxID=1770529 RepID=A0ABW5LZK6_9BACT